MKVKKFLLLFSYLSLACIAQAMEKETFSYLESMPAEVKENILLTAGTLKDTIANMQNLIRTNTGWNNFINDKAETARLITLLSKKYNVPKLYVAALLDTQAAADWVLQNATEKPNDIKKMFAAIRAFPIETHKGNFATGSGTVKLPNDQSFDLKYSNSVIVIFKLKPVIYKGNKEDYPDFSFGVGGYKQLFFNNIDIPTYKKPGIVVPQQGKYIFAGGPLSFKPGVGAVPQIVLARVNSQGDFDTTFNNNNTITKTDMNFELSTPENIVVLNNNQFAVYGYSASYFDPKKKEAFFYILLYDQNGELLDTLILPIAK